MNTKWMKLTMFYYSVLFSISSIVVLAIFMKDSGPVIAEALPSKNVKSHETIYLANESSKISNVFLAETNIKLEQLHLYTTFTEQLPEEIKLDAPLIEKLPEEIKLDAPLIEQLPELPRGCEVTSLAMLLSFHDIHVDKMELAKNVKHNPATFERKNDKTYFGHPNNGFVGDMYSLTTPGLGVYHRPIAQLAEQYASEKTIYDFTGEDFSEVINQVGIGRPVWVIINSWYQKLPESEFTTWHTEEGPIKITYREHSVLITGYDDKYIYFNDPLKYRDKAPIDNFKEAWEQMGKQAITIF